jgi:hypothetical protein
VNLAQAVCVPSGDCPHHREMPGPAFGAGEEIE